ncbi:MAG: hypothetical protein ACRDB6_09170 [Cetobacterium sp.]|uniref:hypothetical protein n=1 Tax=Cetobacterium sp. TaxID=2071632 RepID=UPI003EE4E6BA
MKKINSKIANKLEQKFKETNIVKEAPTVQVVEISKLKEKYTPIINYDEFQLDEVQKELMIQFEEKAIYHANELSKNAIELSKMFYEAQKTLASAGTGSFVRWYEALGFKKDLVYMMLKRNELFMTIQNEKVFQIPEKAIKTISKIKDKVGIEDILDIVNAEKPVIEAKKIEDSLSGCPKEFVPEIEVVDFVDTPCSKIKVLEKKIAEYKKLLKQMESELSNLKKLN